MRRKKGPLEKFLIRSWYRIYNPLRTVYRFLFRPTVRGVKVIPRYQGRVLIVRISYGPKYWTLPGGGVRRYEEWVDAARRELLEETGIVAGQIVEVGEYVSTLEYMENHVKVYASECSSDHFDIDGHEIIEAQWVSPNSLPAPHAPRLPQLLNMAFEK